MAKLGDIASVITKGTTPTSIGYNFAEEGINFIKIESIGEDGTFLPNKFGHINNGCHEALKRSQLAENDILFSIAGAIGRTAIVDKSLLPANTNQALAIIRIPEGRIDYSYLLYALRSPRIAEQFEKRKQGVAQLNLSLKDISELEVPDLSQEEQKNVVGVLDKVSKIIALRKQQLSKLDQLVKARFVEMFGDPSENTLNFDADTGKSLFKFSSGKFLPDEKRLLTGIPVYGGNGIAWYTDESLINHPTLVIGRVGAYCGNVRLIDEPVWITDNAIYIKEFKTSKFSLRFLFYLMNFLNFSQYADFSGQPKITQKPLENTLYIIPPRSLQEEFADFVQKVDQSKSVVKQSAEKLETLKKSLMKEYFG